MLDPVVFSRQHRKTRPFFLLADILLIWLAFEAAYATRSGLQLERAFFLAPAVKAQLLLVCLVGWIAAGMWIGNYDAILAQRLRRMLLKAAQQSVAATAVVVFYQYLQRIDLSRPFLALILLYASLFLVAFRLLARQLAPRILGAEASLRYLYIVGTGPTACRVGRLVEDSERFGLRLAGFLDTTPGVIELQRSYQVEPLDRLPELFGRQVIDEIVFAVDPPRLQELEETLLLCEEEGVRTRIHVQLFPHLHSRVDLERLEGEPMLTFAGAPHDEIRLLLKRGVDFTLALAALAVLSPFLVLIVLLIKLTSPGPAIFRQQRCGLNGRRFTLYKFRTMVADAEQMKAALEHLNVKKTAFKIPNDPRQTAVGRWLRKFSLDELPQLWNIVRGEMAIVGPRPPVPEEVVHYERWQRRRLRMRPGLTCLWTLAGRDEVDFDEWMKLDMAYIDTLVAGARLADHPAHHPARPAGPRRQLDCPTPRAYAPLRRSGTMGPWRAPAAVSGRRRRLTKEPRASHATDSH